jgi:hypothetical protein
MEALALALTELPARPIPESGARDILRDVQLSIVAAAEGAKAAFGINRALTREDFALRAQHHRGNA